MSKVLRNEGRKVHQMLQDRPLDEKTQAPIGQQIFSILLKEEAQTVSSLC